MLAEMPVVSAAADVGGGLVGGVIGASSSETMPPAPAFPLSPGLVAGASADVDFRQNIKTAAL